MASHDLAVQGADVRAIVDKLEAAGGDLEAITPEEAVALMDMIALHQEMEPGA